MCSSSSSLCVDTFSFPFATLVKSQFTFLEPSIFSLFFSFSSISFLLLKIPKYYISLSSCICCYLYLDYYTKDLFAVFIIIVRSLVYKNLATEVLLVQKSLLMSLFNKKNLFNKVGRLIVPSFPDGTRQAVIIYFL